MSIWVLVSDAGRARVFEAATAMGELVEIKSFVHPASRMHENEMASDEPGITHDRVGQGVHGVSSRVDAKTLEAERFARELAETLERERVASKFDRLYIIGSPAFLGQLRKQLRAGTRNLIGGEVDKDLTKLDAGSIRKHLPERL